MMAIDNRIDWILRIDIVCIVIEFFFMILDFCTRWKLYKHALFLYCDFESMLTDIFSIIFINLQCFGSRYV